MCEGTKTEPLYFESLRTAWRLGGTQVVIESPGSAPITIVDAAIVEAARAKAQKTPYDRVYCVFDRDGHESFDRAINKAQASKLDVVASVVSFEFWLLLHFAYTSKSFGKGDQVVRALRGHINDYQKGRFAETLLDRVETALENARKLRKHHETAGNDHYTEPWTDVDLLVVHLKSLAEASA